MRRFSVLRGCPSCSPLTPGRNPPYLMVWGKPLSCQCCQVYSARENSSVRRQDAHYIPRATDLDSSPRRQYDFGKFPTSKTARIPPPRRDTTLFTTGPLRVAEAEDLLTRRRLPCPKTTEVRTKEEFKKGRKEEKKRMCEEKEKEGEEEEEEKVGKEEQEAVEEAEKEKDEEKKREEKEVKENKKKSSWMLEETEGQGNKKRRMPSSHMQRAPSRTFGDKVEMISMRQTCRSQEENRHPQDIPPHVEATALVCPRKNSPDFGCLSSHGSNGDNSTGAPGSPGIPVPVQRKLGKRKAPKLELLLPPSGPLPCSALLQQLWDQGDLPPPPKIRRIDTEKASDITKNTKGQSIQISDEVDALQPMNQMVSVHTASQPALSSPPPASGPTGFLFLSTDGVSSPGPSASTPFLCQAAGPLNLLVPSPSLTPNVPTIPISPSALPSDLLPPCRARPSEETPPEEEKVGKEEQEAVEEAEKEKDEEKKREEKEVKENKKKSSWMLEETEGQGNKKRRMPSSHMQRAPSRTFGDKVEMISMRQTCRSQEENRHPQDIPPHVEATALVCPRKNSPDFGCLSSHGSNGDNSTGAPGSPGIPVPVQRKLGKRKAPKLELLLPPSGPLPCSALLQQLWDQGDLPPPPKIRRIDTEKASDITKNTKGQSIQTSDEMDALQPMNQMVSVHTASQPALSSPPPASGPTGFLFLSTDGVSSPGPPASTPLLCQAAGPLNLLVPSPSLTPNVPTIPISPSALPSDLLPPCRARPSEETPPEEEKVGKEEQEAVEEAEKEKDEEKKREEKEVKENKKKSSWMLEETEGQGNKKRRMPSSHMQRAPSRTFGDKVEMISMRQTCRSQEENRHPQDIPPHVEATALVCSRKNSPDFGCLSSHGSNGDNSTGAPGSPGIPVPVQRKLGKRKAPKLELLLPPSGPLPCSALLQQLWDQGDLPPPPKIRRIDTEKASDITKNTKGQSIQISDEVDALQPMNQMVSVHTASQPALSSPPPASGPTGAKKDPVDLATALASTTSHSPRSGAELLSFSSPSCRMESPVPMCITDSSSPPLPATSLAPSLRNPPTVFSTTASCACEDRSWELSLEPAVMAMDTTPPSEAAVVSSPTVSSDNTLPFAPRHGCMQQRLAENATLSTGPLVPKIPCYTHVGNNLHTPRPTNGWEQGVSPSGDLAILIQNGLIPVLPPTVAISPPHAAEDFEFMDTTPPSKAAVLPSSTTVEHVSNSWPPPTVWRPTIAYNYPRGTPQSTIAYNYPRGTPQSTIAYNYTRGIPQSTIAYNYTRGIPQSTIAYNYTRGTPQSTIAYNYPRGTPQSTIAYNYTRGIPQSTIAYNYTRGIPQSTIAYNYTRGIPQSTIAYNYTRGIPQSTIAYNYTRGIPQSTIAYNYTRGIPQSTIAYNYTRGTPQSTHALLNGPQSDGWVSMRNPSTSIAATDLASLAGQPAGCSTTPRQYASSKPPANLGRPIGTGRASGKHLCFSYTAMPTNVARSPSGLMRPVVSPSGENDQRGKPTQGHVSTPPMYYIVRRKGKDSRDAVPPIVLKLCCSATHSGDAVQVGLEDTGRVVHGSARALPGLTSTQGHFLYRPNE